jgi:uncharacterized protein YjbI with pentapeptide repeats
MKRQNIFTLTLILSAIVMIELILLGNAVSWTGFAGKTLWDWLDLFIIPLVLAVIAFWLNRSQKEREQQISSDNLHETELQAYLESMSKLLLEKRLREKDPDSDERLIARANTLRAFRKLDNKRKKYVLDFLNEAELIAYDTKSDDQPIVLLSGANLEGLDLSGTDLTGLDLRAVSLTQVNLKDALLVDANLDHAVLRNADLKGANLSGAFLNFADLSYADLRSTKLHKAELFTAKLVGADLRKTDLSEADLTSADLSDATLDHWDQLKSAASLENTVLPNNIIRD